MIREFAHLLFLGCALSPAAAPAQQIVAPPAVEAIATQPTEQSGASRAILLAGDAAPLIVGTAELAGLEIYDLTGRRIGSVEAGEAVGVDVRYGALPALGALTALLVAADATSGTLRFYRRNGPSLVEISARPVALGIALEGACMYRSAQDGSLYAFALGDGGEVDQYLLYANSDGRVDARKVRRLQVPSTAEFCVADDRTGDLYVSEQAVGIWRFNAEPETEVVPALIDAVRLGRITEEVSGVALYDGGDQARWLIASNASAGQLFVYDHNKDDAYVGVLTVSSGGAAVDGPGGLFATSAALGNLANGALIVADEDASGGSNYKLVPFSKVAEAAKIAPGSPQPLTVAVSPTFPTVVPTVETIPVGHGGDAADDPAIWANPSDPAASLVIGTDKQGGLHLYDMRGRSIQYTADGKMNNVDLREDFRLGGAPVILVTVSDRTNKAVAIYRLDTAARRLVSVSDGIQATGLSDPYGQCMYRSPRTGRYYVFVSDPDGLVRQWELIATRNGTVRLKQVRDLKFSSQTEGCVADDRSGTLYVAEEDIGLWTVTAEPVRATPVALDKVESNPKIKDDLEGVGIYDLGSGRGYLIVSSQGNNSYSVYRREGDGAYLGSFSVIADASRGIDGVSETDGLEVSSANLGPGFEHGALIAQDGRNVMPEETQNFKLVPWQAIADALKLEVRR